MTKIVLAGGGTAGHTSPLIATAQALKARQPDVEIVCVGTSKGLETTVIPAAGLKLSLIPSVPLPRKPTPQLLAVPLRVRDAVSQAKQILRGENADVVAGFGGYVSLPVYLAARSLSIPVVVHEGNARAGLANKVAARFAKVVAVAFPGTQLPGAQLVGLPVRQQIAGLDRVAARSSARAFFKLGATGPAVLVSGGSQGARSLNQAVIGAKERVLAQGVSILHVLGAANTADQMVSLTDAQTQAVYRPLAYVSAMEDAYAAADLMLGRSGAATVIETAMVGLPTVFVPLPHGNGEQALNAQFLVNAGAAIVLPDAELSAEWVAGSFAPLAHNEARLSQMSQAARSLVSPDAADKLAELILGLVK
ncbi:MAG: undecaprenyldiphospho-muramoylpentapeptide beta-N-acetylglucosaminyltransferase [Propionibacteriaceae bacterium]|jgi:UDP-N-acetylglucosamine--N-acetylmuramyl-(pentapeptide) pyrophosphoryl-undecaprenol N-acetylglucosamine transferase|nr:undecaprenyldiphospho-muramoylpentapeptide beta-N-acetylglucosaminyltransferase [Propionibacteriaceae bacterium]